MGRVVVAREEVVPGVGGLDEDLVDARFFDADDGGRGGVVHVGRPVVTARQVGVDDVVELEIVARRRGDRGRDVEPLVGRGVAGGEGQGHGAAAVHHGLDQVGIRLGAGTGDRTLAGLGPVVVRHGHTGLRPAQRAAVSQVDAVEDAGAGGGRARVVHLPRAVTPDLQLSVAGQVDAQAVARGDPTAGVDVGGAGQGDARQ